ncbi:uncharacterized protein BO66DRAFT_448087 [Aspergillus aculeatinus CBS 121060]|uniref:Uncharacterized protein n=1 Tax=Aspergillus aculeatinus CBS 121060 TaxID=1448322 RepID=A0ACD1HDT8_9EURO|nr:hypothetical protein BO66DRAFT_448087 [Aspergillus aculeatinus CBS 121060]RAH71806.1 hypothetical protein BO66DRAFT_448087 [Aspergillus aculeatinus CBS 121060]
MMRKWAIWRKTSRQMGNSVHVIERVTSNGLARCFKVDFYCKLDGRWAQYCRGRLFAKMEALQNPCIEANFLGPRLCKGKRTLTPNSPGILKPQFEPSCRNRLRGWKIVKRPSGVYVPGSVRKVCASTLGPRREGVSMLVSSHSVPVIGQSAMCLRYCLVAMDQDTRLQAHCPTSLDETHTRRSLADKAGDSSRSINAGGVISVKAIGNVISPTRPLAVETEVEQYSGVRPGPEPISTRPLDFRIGSI